VVVEYRLVGGREDVAFVQHFVAVEHRFAADQESFESEQCFVVVEYRLVGGPEDVAFEQHFVAVEHRSVADQEDAEKRFVADQEGIDSEQHFVVVEQRTVGGQEGTVAPTQWTGEHAGLPKEHIAVAEKWAVDAEEHKLAAEKDTDAAADQVAD
jgi:hypothetical protein